MAFEQEKIHAAKAALGFIRDGMVVGLGSGSTAREFIKLLAQKIHKEKWGIVGVPTSFDSRVFAIGQGIRIAEPDEVDRIDLAVDGADVATKTALLKGGGGALTREKVVAYTARKFIVIADESKIQPVLEGDLVVEVVPFAHRTVMDALKRYTPHISYRSADAKLGPIITDNGNFLLDCRMRIRNPKKTEVELNAIPGVVENGIFTKFDTILVGTKEGHRVL